MVFDCEPALSTDLERSNYRCPIIIETSKANQDQKFRYPARCQTISLIPNDPLISKLHINIFRDFIYKQKIDFMT
jgi:hypothetical protein